MPPTLLFGAGGIGAGRITRTWTTSSETSTLLTTLLKLSLVELDSAASYLPGAPWTTETLLGEAKAADKGFVVDTKILAGGGVDILYAHTPDKQTPLEETVKAFDKHYRAGKFKQLGLSNFNTAQMIEYLQICEANNYIKPAIYQGHYNAIVRQDENTLLPLLRAHNIKIYAYGPLAGGFLTGKVTLPPPEEKTKLLEGGRFHAGNFPMYLEIFDTEVCHAAIKEFVGKCEKEGLGPTEVSLRWIVHHSMLGEGDGIILGATKVLQLKGNVEFCRKGPLGEGLVRACEELWVVVGGKLGNV